MSVDKSKRIFNITALCLVWYVVSSTNNVIGKMVLSTFPYPMTVTMVQLTSITLYSGPFFNLWGIRKYSDISWNYYFKLIIPLALGKFFSSVTSHISIWKVPVSYAHTGKSNTHHIQLIGVNFQKTTGHIIKNLMIEPVVWTQYVYLKKKAIPNGKIPCVCVRVRTERNICFYHKFNEMLKHL